MKNPRVYYHKYVPLTCKNTPKRLKGLQPMKNGRGVPAPYFGGAVPAPYFGGAIPAPYFGGMRVGKKRGKGFASFLARTLPAVFKIGKKIAPRLKPLIEMGIDRGTEYLFRKGDKFLGSTADKIRQKFGPKYGPMINAGENFIRTGANKLLVSGRDYAKQKLQQELADFERLNGQGMAFKRLASMPSLKGKGKMFSKPKRLTMPFGGTLLSGPIP